MIPNSRDSSFDSIDWDSQNDDNQSKPPRKTSQDSRTEIETVHQISEKEVNDQRLSSMPPVPLVEKKCVNEKWTEQEKALLIKTVISYPYDY